jgi:catechol 2,3-dioxygenase-like lactoylglutathione lyase family enzyme
VLRDRRHAFVFLVTVGRAIVVMNDLRVRGIMSAGGREHQRDNPPAPRERSDIVDWKLELVAVPVSDVDRAKAFYTERAGFAAEHDHRVSDEIRFVQLTPPGSACSIALGTGIVDTAPGSVQGLQLVVPDVHAARAELLARGVEVSEVQEFDWGSFVFFRDPDGNGWSVQQIPARG